MKRIISAFILIGLCIGICAFGSIATEKRCKELILALDKTEEAILSNNEKKTSEYINNLEDQWKRDEKLFSSLSETSLIDELNVSLLSLEKHIKTQKYQEALILIDECRNSLEIIYQWQKLSLDNIL